MSTDPVKSATRSFMRERVRRFDPHEHHRPPSAPLAIPDLTTVEGATHGYHQGLLVDLRDVVNHFVAHVSVMATPGPQPPQAERLGPADTESKGWLRRRNAWLEWQHTVDVYDREAFRGWLIIYEKALNIVEHAKVVMRRHVEGRHWVEHAMEAQPKYLAAAARTYFAPIVRERGVAVAQQMVDRVRGPKRGPAVEVEVEGELLLV